MPTELYTEHIVRKLIRTDTNIQLHTMKTSWMRLWSTKWMRGLNYLPLQKASIKKSLKQSGRTTKLQKRKESTKLQSKMYNRKMHEYSYNCFCICNYINKLDLLWRALIKKTRFQVFYIFLRCVYQKFLPSLKWNSWNFPEFQKAKTKYWVFFIPISLGFGSDISQIFQMYVLEIYWTSKTGNLGIWFLGRKKSLAW